MDLPILDISYKLNYTMHGHLCLASFTYYNDFSAHLCCRMLSELNSILCQAPLIGDTICHLSVHQLMDIWGVSTFDYYDNAAMNIYM